VTRLAYPRRVVSVTIERLQTPRGELVLRRDGEHHEIVSNGMFLMDTRDGRSERELVRAAVDGPGRRVLIGGLGVGFSLAAALALDPAAVTVVEIEPAVVRWNRDHLKTALDDPRVELVIDDLAAFLAAGEEKYDTICLDVDNGPEWTVTVDNAVLYGDDGLSAVDRHLAPGGTLAVWSANRAPAFEARLRARYRAVEVVEIPVPRGEPDVVYVARPPSADRPDRQSRARHATRPPAAPSPPTGTRSAAAGPGRTP
jgi:spermidine synthase